MSTRPAIGITCDVSPSPTSGRPICSAALAYVECVARAGGVPILLPPAIDRISEYLSLCSGFVFTGGGDPRMEAFGVPTHPKASLMDPRRQAFELALLRALESDHPKIAVLGVCLGMQLMSLGAGGMLDQHMPDSLPTHADHYQHEHLVNLQWFNDADNATSSPRSGMEGERNSLASTPNPGPRELDGLVASHHRQRITDPGRLQVIARAHDQTIEGVLDPARPFCVGVQWHPERTSDPRLGQAIFDRFVAAASTRT